MNGPHGPHEIHFSDRKTTRGMPPQQNTSFEQIQEYSQVKSDRHWTENNDFHFKSN